MKDYLNYLVIDKKDFIFSVGDIFKYVGSERNRTLVYYPIKAENQYRTNSNSDSIWQRSKSIGVPKKYEKLIINKAKNIHLNLDGDYEVVDVDKDFKIPTANKKLYYLGINSNGKFIFEEREIKSNTQKQVILLESLYYRERHLKTDMDMVHSKDRFGSSLVGLGSIYGIYFMDFEKYDHYKELLYDKMITKINNNLNKFIREYNDFSKNIENEGFVINNQLKGIVDKVNEYLETKQD